MSLDTDEVRQILHERSYQIEQFPDARFEFGTSTIKQNIVLDPNGDAPRRVLNPHLLLGQIDGFDGIRSFDIHLKIIGSHRHLRVHSRSGPIQRQVHNSHLAKGFFIGKSRNHGFTCHTIFSLID